MIEWTEELKALRKTVFIWGKMWQLKHRRKHTIYNLYYWLEVDDHDCPLCQVTHMDCSKCPALPVWQRGAMCEPVLGSYRVPCENYSDSPWWLYYNTLSRPIYRHHDLTVRRRIWVMYQEMLKLYKKALKEAR